MHPTNTFDYDSDDDSDMSHDYIIMMTMTMMVMVVPALATWQWQMWSKPIPEWDTSIHLNWLLVFELQNETDAEIETNYISKYINHSTANINTNGWAAQPTKHGSWQQPPKRLCHSVVCCRFKSFPSRFCYRYCPKWHKALQSSKFYPAAYPSIQGFR